MQIRIRNYRAIERADLALDRIALIAGRNEQGKTCVVQAAQAALTGIAITVPGVLKKDAKLLVRDGSDDGSVILSNGAATSTVEWPKASFKTTAKDGSLTATPFAAGLSHIFDLDANARAAALAPYVKAWPTEAEVRAEAEDAGYGPDAVDKLWGSLKPSLEDPSAQWNSTYQRAREYGTKLRGQWEEAAGESYGSKKGGTFTPKDYVEGVDREALQQRVETNAAYVIEVAGKVAVSAAEIERLKGVVAADPTDEAIKAAVDESAALLAQLEQRRADRARLPSSTAKLGVTEEPVQCPKCETPLAVLTVRGEPYRLSVYVPKGAPSKDELKEAAKADGDIARLTPELDAATKRHRSLDLARARALDAAAKLTKAAGQGGASVTEIEKAQADEADARAKLKAFDAKVRCEALHESIAKNEKLVAILAPDGLRRRKLAKGLVMFNEQLALVSAIAGWPVVRLDESLNPHYGTRPVWAASKSGQWRARTVVQAVMAQLDGSAAIVLDEADILDSTGRNGLFKMLDTTECHALVAMTIGKKELVPDLAKIGLGCSYWVESNVVEEL